MPTTPDQTPELSQSPRPKQPLFERIQDWIFRLDVGFGVQWFRLGLFLLFVMLVVLLYTGTQFYGLHEREAMDLGQLGRNLAAGRGYVTRNIRPIDLAYLNSIGQPALSPNKSTVPELWTPPVYPFVLSLFFHVLKPEANLDAVAQQLNVAPHELPPGGNLSNLQHLQAFYAAAGSQTLRMDRLLVILAWLMFMLGMGVLYLLARELFDHRVAMLSVFLYLLCDPLLSACVGGSMLPFLALLLMLSAYALVKAKQWSETKTSVYWPCSALVFCGLVVGLGTLSDYAFFCVLAPLVLFLITAMPRLKLGVKLGVVLGVVALLWLPWVIRNEAVSGTAFGLTHWVATEILPNDVGEETARIQFERQFELSPTLRWHKIATRALMNWKKLFRENFKETGANYLIAFFLVALLHRFKRDEVFRLQWYVFWSMIMAVVWLGFAGLPQRNFFTVFVPLVTIYGAAFFLVMFERLQFRARWIRRGMVSLFVVVNVVPMLLTLLPPPPYSPYPPYDGGVVAAIGATFPEEDLLASDIPWAVAWYSDHSAVLMVNNQKDYIKINDEMHVIAGLYMTQKTLLELKMPEVMAGYGQFWLTKYHQPEPSLGLSYLRHLTPDEMQVLLSNLPR